MNALADHPSKAELSAFALGKLPEESSTAIEDHLAACESCSVTLASVADDTLIGMLASHDDADIHEGGWIDVRLDDPEQTVAHTETVVADLPTELVDHPRYRVLRLLGRGGMGDVYLAEHRLMERLVAIKVMKRKLMGRADAVERFRREVKTVAQLKHENIVTAYDAEQAGDLHLLVMEYVEGRDLATEVKQCGALPIHDACDYARQVALGLAHAHMHGMVHRDVKPHNLMLVDGQVKILDLGLAQLVQAVAERPQQLEEETAASLTGARSVLGTPDYIAPEQISDAHRADHRADIYSLGATLYYLISGRTPFTEGSATERITAHLSQNPTDVRELRPDIPEELAHVIRRMMAKVPSQRYPSAECVAEELAPFCREPQRALPEPQTASSSFWAWAIAPVFLAILAGGVWGFWQIVITIRDRDGNVTRIEADRVEITGNKGVEMKVSGATPQSARSDTEQEVAAITLVGRLQGHEGPVFSVSASPDGKLIASASMDGTVRLWDVESERQLRVLMTSSQPVRSAVFSPDGQHVLAAGHAKDVHLYEVATGKEIKTFPTENEGAYQVAFSPDGREAASIHYEGALYRWDVATGGLIEQVTASEGFGWAVDYSPTGDSLLVCYRDALRVYDRETGDERQLFKPWLDGWVRAFRNATFSPDGRTIAAGTFDGRIGLIDVAGHMPPRTLSGHAAVVAGLAFTEDGRHLLSGGMDKQLCVWSIESGKKVASMKTDVECVSWFALLPGGRVISGGETWDPQTRNWARDDDYSLRIWLLPEFMRSSIGDGESPDDRPGR